MKKTEVEKVNAQGERRRENGCGDSAGGEAVDVCGRRRHVTTSMDRTQDPRSPKLEKEPALESKWPSHW